MDLLALISAAQVVVGEAQDDRQKPDHKSTGRQWKTKHILVWSLQTLQRNLQRQLEQQRRTR